MKEAAVQADDVVTFWRDAGPQRWFKKDAAFDADFRARFLAAHDAAARGALDDWARDAQGSLALLILLDQFPRNAFRNSPRMFATDAQALSTANAAVDAGHDMAVEQDLRNFIYLQARPIKKRHAAKAGCRPRHPGANRRPRLAARTIDK